MALRTYFRTAFNGFKWAIQAIFRIFSFLLLPVSQSTALDRASDLVIAPDHNNDKRIRIIVVTLTGKRQECEIYQHDLVKTLKRMIQEKEGIPVDQQRIIYGSAQLEDDQKLSDYGIGNLSCVHCVLRLRGGGIPVFALSFSTTGTISLVYGWKKNLTDLRDAFSRPELLLVETRQIRNNEHQLRMVFKPSISYDYSALTVKNGVIDFLTQAYSQGGEIMGSSILDRSLTSVTWYFDQGRPKPAARIFSLCLLPTGRFQMIGAASSVFDSVQPTIDQFFSSTTPITKSSQPYYTDTWAINNAPWTTTDPPSRIATCKFLLAVIQKFYGAGYRFYVRGDFDEQLAETLFFIQMENSDHVQHQFSMITTNGHNLLTLVGCQPDMHDVVMSTIRDSWQPGIRRHSGSPLEWEFVLNGLPWYKYSDYANSARRLFVDLTRLSTIGWFVEGAFHIGQTQQKKPIFLFRRGQPTLVQHFALVPETSSIRIIGAPAKVVQAIERIANPSASEPIKQMKDAVRITFDGSSSHQDFLCSVLHSLCYKGCKAVGTVCLANLLDEPLENEYGRPHATDQQPDLAETMFFSYSGQEAISLQETEM